MLKLPILINLINQIKGSIANHYKIYFNKDTKQAGAELCQAQVKLS